MKIELLEEKLNGEPIYLITELKEDEFWEIIRSGIDIDGDVCQCINRFEDDTSRIRVIGSLVFKKKTSPKVDRWIELDGDYYRRELGYVDETPWSTYDDWDKITEHINCLKYLLRQARKGKFYLKAYDYLNGGSEWYDDDMTEMSDYIDLLEYELFLALNRWKPNNYKRSIKSLGLEHCE